MAVISSPSSSTFDALCFSVLWPFPLFFFSLFSWLPGRLPTFGFWKEHLSNIQNRKTHVLLFRCTQSSRHKPSNWRQVNFVKIGNIGITYSMVLLIGNIDMWWNKISLAIYIYICMYVSTYEIISGHATLLIIQKSLIMATELGDRRMDRIPTRLQQCQRSRYRFIVSFASFIHVFNSNLASTVIVLRDVLPVSEEIFLTALNGGLGIF